MTRKILLAGSAIGAIAAGALTASPAFAAGTASGTVITNTVTVNYQVGGIAQPEETAENEITVDRKVNLLVTRVDNTATPVTPGASEQAVSFNVQNLSNATLDFALSAERVSEGGASGFSGAVDFVVEPTLTFYLDDGDGIFNETTPITHLDSLAPDATARVWVVANVPTGIADGAIAAITLTATAHEDNNDAALGDALVEATVNTAGVDTIFADGAGIDDGARDAAFSATDDFVVVTATVTATKTSRIVAGDFSTGAAIPGATVEYCITVSNTGSAAATNIAISDTIPAELTYADGVWVGGVDCDTPGPADGDETGGIVTGTIATLGVGTEQTLIFQATID